MNFSSLQVPYSREKRRGVQKQIKSKRVNRFLDAAIASLQEVLSVDRSVGWLVGPLVRNAFVKIAKSIEKSLFFACLCMYIAVSSIHWPVHQLFCQSVHFSIHLSVHPSMHTSVTKLYR